MLLQLSRKAKSEYVKLRALELVMLHESYDLSVLSNSPSGKASKKNGNTLKDLTMVEPTCNQQDDSLVGCSHTFDSESLETSTNESETTHTVEHPKLPENF